MVRNKRSSEEWLDIIEQQRLSGQTMKEWCAENGVNLYTMADRISRFRKEGLITGSKPKRIGKPAQWVEVTSGICPAKTEDNLPAAEMSVKIGVFSIMVPPNFDEKSFIRVCKSVMSLC